MLASTWFLLASGVAGAAVPGVNGRIAFQTDRDGNDEIYTAEANGTGVVNVSANPASDSDPDLSPDGSRIAFVSDRDGNTEIYVMNVDGTGVARLTTSPSDDSTPSWSPDGTRIVFQTNRFGPFDIAVINADGTGVRRVTTSRANDETPAWAPDGNRIAFASDRDGDFEIYVASAGGSGVKRVTDNRVLDANPAWAPDASAIAFDSTRSGNVDVYTAKPDGTGLKRLTTSAARDSFPSYSPDGTRIAFSSSRNGNDEIYTMTAAGNSETRRSASGSSELLPSWGRVPPGTPPQAGSTATATVVKGRVKIKLPGSGAFIELDNGALIPIGSTLDTTKGTLRLVTSDAAGGTQSGDFYEGVFKLAQKKGKALTDLRLSGGSFKKCPKARRSATLLVPSKAKSVRHLWGNAAGKFRTVGKYAAASVRGTTWLTEDRCDGTLVRVTEGSVSVRDFRRRRTVVVTAGRSYLARA